MREVFHNLLKIIFNNRVVQFAWLKIYWAKLRYNMKYSDKEFSYKYYKSRTNRTLNLEEPKTFDDKMWYLKLNNRDPLLTKCSDKYLVREYVKECGLDIILNELYGVYSNANEINFDTLQSPCIIKCNHVSGINAIYNKDIFFDKQGFIKKFNFMMHQNYYWLAREWNYKNIEPRIVCEKLLVNNDGTGLVDYKFLCFGGKVKYLFVDIDLCAEDGSHRKDGKRNVYDKDFNLLDVKVTRERYDPNLVSKPDNFEKMKEYAQILSKPFTFCRVDLYNVNGKIIFGEITFYHTAGCTNIEPNEWNYILGDCIDLNNNSRVQN